MSDLVLKNRGLLLDAVRSGLTLYEISKVLNVSLVDLRSSIYSDEELSKYLSDTSGISPSVLRRKLSELALGLHSDVEEETKVIYDANNERMSTMRVTKVKSRAPNVKALQDLLSVVDSDWRKVINEKRDLPVTFDMQVVDGKEDKVDDTKSS